MSLTIRVMHHVQNTDAQCSGRTPDACGWAVSHEASAEHCESSEVLWKQSREILSLEGIPGCSIIMSLHFDSCL